jgi:hypothetical protein
MTSLRTAPIRFSPVPQPPVRKKNGMSMRSKKTTKSARSWAIKAPSSAVSPRPSQKKNSPGRA